MAEGSVAERLLGYAQHKVHPQVRVWSEATTITANLWEELAGDLERLESDALASQFSYHCRVEGAEQGDYKNRLLKVGGLELLTGIRFRGLDMAQPFVDVIYHSESTMSLERLEDVKAFVRRDYAVFKPKRLRFYGTSQLPALPGEGDKRLVAAPLRVVLEQSAPLGQVELKGAASLEFYPEYATIYEQLHAENPELIPVTRAESEKDLQGYLEAGNLFEIFVDGVWAGVCAVFTDVASGIRGFCFGEIVLAPAFRGRGLGSVVQIELAKGLVARGEDPEAFLFGTIGAVNHPALRAAARAGRLDLGGHVWLGL